MAGDAVDASSDVFDEFGNRIDDADIRLISDTSSSGIVIDDDELSASVTTSGIFTFSCLVEDADNRFGTPLEVLPHKPAELSASPMPNQEIYGLGQVVTIETHVVDRYGNIIDRPEIDFESLPTGESFGEGRYRFNQEGIYTVTATVAEDTFNDELVEDDVQIIVNETGPDINCLAPADGEMVDHSPGTPVAFEGTATDAHGTQSIFVNGEEVPLEGGDKGALDFETTVETDYGINFVDIAAEDEYGEENVRTCAFLVSDNWTEEDAFLDDAVSLSLFQPAVDDGQFTPGELDSLNDIIRTALNSDGLEEMLEDELVDAGPFDVGTCSADLYIEGLSLHHGPDHVTAIDLVDGGISMDATFNEITIDLFIDAAWYCGGNYSPTADIAYLDIGLTADLELSGANQPSMSLRGGEVDYVESGSVSLSGGNVFSSALYSAIDSLFQGTLRGLIEDTFADQIEDVFDDTVGDLLESLDVDSLATSFDVPRLDSDDTMSLNFGFQFSTIDVSNNEAQFGLAPRLYPGWPNIPDGDSPGQNSLGVAHPPGAMLADHTVPSAFNTQHSAAAGAHVVLLNQALHSLWRAGLFHANVGGALGDSLPDDVSVELAVDLPPVIRLHDDPDDGAELMLGAAHLELVYPGIFDDPVTLTAGVVASTGVDLNDAELSFDDVTIDEFYLSPQEISLNSETRDILEDFIQDLLQDIIDQSLNSALPALPIPSFEVPPGMADFDLPNNADIGLYDTSMDQDERHLELYGSFGVQ